MFFVVIFKSNTGNDLREKRQQRNKATRQSRLVEMIADVVDMMTSAFGLMGC
jgi:hypothetical protein